MSKKKEQKEPWSQKFGEEENLKNRQYTRSARKSSKNEVAPLYKVLLFFFLALLIIPFATIYWNERTKGTPEPKTSEQVMANKKGTKAEEEKKKEENEKAAASSAKAETERKKEEEAAAASSLEKEKQKKAEEAEESSLPKEPEEREEPDTEPAEPETPALSEEEPEKKPETDGEYNNTYTVVAGDNLYRIALNHGMDLQELKTVNGLTSDIAEIGMVLKVR